MISKHFHDWLEVIRTVKKHNQRLYVILRGFGDDYQDYVGMKIFDFFKKEGLCAILVDPDKKQRTHTVPGMLHEVRTRYIKENDHIIINNESGLFEDYIKFHKLGEKSEFVCLTLDLIDNRDSIERTPHHHTELDRSYFDAPDAPVINWAQQPSAL